MKINDINPYFSVGLPILSILSFCVIAMIDPQFYYHYISISEKGYLEHSTVIMLLLSILSLSWIIYNNTYLKSKWILSWISLLLLGCIYFAGEEASWGQHYFGWITPEWWKQFNDQGETNIHNVHGIFDHLPRLLLTLATVFTLIASPIMIRYRRHWDSMKKWQDWIFPTMASFTAAFMAAFVGLPQKFYGYYGPKEDHIPTWFDAMFLRGHHSELKEHFIAMFIMMYVFSLAYRFWCIKSIQQVESNTDEPDLKI